MAFHLLLLILVLLYRRFPVVHAAIFLGTSERLCRRLLPLMLAAAGRWLPLLSLLGAPSVFPVCLLSAAAAANTAAGLAPA